MSGLLSFTIYATTRKDMIIVSDMKSHLAVVDECDTQRFISILQSCGRQQHLYESTHVHRLCNHIGTLTRDHFAESFVANIAMSASSWNTISFRKLCSVNVDSFKRDIAASTMLPQSGGSVDVLLNAYIDGLK